MKTGENAIFNLECLFLPIFTDFNPLGLTLLDLVIETFILWRVVKLSSQLYVSLLPPSLHTAVRLHVYMDFVKAIEQKL